MKQEQYNEIKATWGGQIATLLATLERAGVLIETPQRVIVAMTGKFTFIAAKKGGGENGSFKQSIAGGEFFGYHFVSNEEAFLYFQNADVSPEWEAAVREAAAITKSAREAEANDLKLDACVKSFSRKYYGRDLTEDDSEKMRQAAERVGEIAKTI